MNKLTKLIDASQLPERGPDVPYSPGPDVASWNPAGADPVVAEVYVRPEGTFGVRIAVWVAWRDAGDNIRSHSWHRVLQAANLVTDSLSTAQTSASSYLAAYGFYLPEQWHAG